MQTLVRKAPADVEGIRPRFGDAMLVEAPHGGDPETSLDVRIAFDGVPEGMRATPDLVDLEFEARDGWKWDCGWRNPYAGRERVLEPDSWVSIVTPKAVLENARRREVTLRLAMSLMVLGPERTEEANLRNGEAAVAGVGICRVAPRPGLRDVVNCKNSAVPEAAILAPVARYQYAPPLEFPYQVGFGASPVWRTTLELPRYWDGEIAFKLRRPVAHLRRELVMERVRLSDYR